MRLDTYLAQTYPQFTRNRWKMLIEQGVVFVDGISIRKSSYEILQQSVTYKLPNDWKYVSRSGGKLSSFLKQNTLYLHGICLDIGSSTGGFTQVALEYGAKKIIAVDVGTQQLHESLRSNPAIELHEEMDIRNFRTDQKIDWIVVDVSFIAIENIFDAIIRFCSEGTQIIFLFKPQFQVPAHARNKSGVVTNIQAIDTARKKFEQHFSSRFLWKNSAPSQITGEAGNQEWLYHGVYKNPSQ